MASSEMPPPSLWQGVQIVPPDNLTLAEEVLPAAGEQVALLKNWRPVALFCMDYQVLSGSELWKRRPIAGTGGLSMTRNIKTYTAACPICAHGKSSHQPPAGLLHTLPVP